MQVSVVDAPDQLDDLVARAEAGEDVVLTRNGRPAVRLVAASSRPSAEERGAVLDRVVAMVATLPKSEISAARSQDFLYDENGLPA